MEPEQDFEREMAANGWKKDGDFYEQGNFLIDRDLAFNCWALTGNAANTDHPDVYLLPF